jgi:acetamidase/formamidase
MATHRLAVERSDLHASFSQAAVPRLVIEPGDSVELSIPDVSWGLEPPTSTTAPRRKVEPRDPVRDQGPCLVGPIGVRDAAPGDALAITFERIRPGPWGWTYSGGPVSTPALNGALGIGDAPLTLLRWTLDEDRKIATSDRGDRVAVAPFLGTIGVSPAEDHASGWLPRNCGGNMDCRELIEGSMLWLPVMVHGALLSLGDGHAAQGDAELSGTAIECAMELVRIRVELVKSAQIRSPRVRTLGGQWVTLGFGPTLDTAAEHAAVAMLDLMIEHTQRPRAELLALASSQVSLRITQMVNPHRGVHAIWHGGSAGDI